MPNALVVDDDASQRRLLLRALEKDGWSVETAPSGTAALEAYTAGFFELLVTDINLGDFNGIDLAKALSKQQPTLKVIVVSGLPENLYRARLAGFSACLQKPFGMEELWRLVRA